MLAIACGVVLAVVVLRVTRSIWVMIGLVAAFMAWNVWVARRR